MPGPRSLLHSHSLSTQGALEGFYLVLVGLIGDANRCSRYRPSHLDNLALRMQPELKLIALILSKTKHATPSEAILLSWTIMGIVASSEASSTRPRRIDPAGPLEHDQQSLGKALHLQQKEHCQLVKIRGGKRVKTNFAKLLLYHMNPSRSRAA